MQLNIEAHTDNANDADADPGQVTQRLNLFLKKDELRMAMCHLQSDIQQLLIVPGQGNFVCAMLFYCTDVYAYLFN